MKLDQFTYIDLTYELGETTPPYPGKTCFTRVINANYENGYCTEDINLSTGIGTHMDSPKHFFPTLPAIDNIAISSLVAYACVMNVSHNVLNNVDYLITVDDVMEWESKNGKILQNSIFLAYTGWSNLWSSEKYCYVDNDGICHFPGFSAQAVKLLAQRKVKGVGIDTMGIDAGCVVRFEAHEILLKQNIFLLENLTALDQLPPTGAIIIALPLKIKNAPEAPVRAIAIIEAKNSSNNLTDSDA